MKWTVRKHLIHHISDEAYLFCNPVEINFCGTVSIRAWAEADGTLRITQVQLNKKTIYKGVGGEQENHKG